MSNSLRILGGCDQIFIIETLVKKKKMRTRSLQGMDEVYCSYEGEFSQRLNILNMAMWAGAVKTGEMGANRQELKRPREYRAKMVELQEREAGGRDAEAQALGGGGGLGWGWGGRCWEEPQELSEAFPGFL